MKKPTLKLVASSKPTASPPPAILDKSGRQLWQSIQAQYQIDDSGGYEMLVQICRALDRAEQCATEIERDGPTIPTRGGGMRDHPLIKHELANRSFVLRSLHRLGLDIEPTRASVGCPPGPRVK